MNIGGVITNDLANGEGIRTSVFVSGCDHRCFNCHNPELWDYNYGTKMTDQAIGKIIESLNKDGIKKHLSILGGEPLMPKNRNGVLYLVATVKHYLPDTKIWLWTGYDLADLLDKEESTFLQILEFVDTIIDGPYDEKLKPGKHLWRGSSNQRIWDKTSNGNFKIREEK